MQLFTTFTSAEMTALNAGDDNLTAVIAAAAARAGVRFVDVRTPFVGHAVCDASPWIKNVNIVTQWESFHPTANGQLYGYKPGVASAFGVTGTASAAMTVTVGGQTASDASRGTVSAG